jgi:hypothetical protein
MLWYKSWLDTRWRFGVGLVLLVVAAVGSVLVYPQILELLSMSTGAPAEGALGRRVDEGLQLARSFQGYIWSQWFRQNSTQLVALFAMILGTGGLVAQGAGGVTLFTLSLPVSRERLLGVRAAVGLAELGAIVIASSLVVPLVSLAIGQSFGVGDAIVHAICLFVGAATLFGLTSYFSTLFSDQWKPMLAALCVAGALATVEQVWVVSPRASLFRVMSGELYFRSGELPWPGLLGSAVVTGLLLYAASRTLAARDF